METEISFNKETNIRDYRRESIIRFIAQGVSQKAIAEGLGCSQGLVSQVKSAYGSQGAGGIKTQTPPGAPVVRSLPKGDYVLKIESSL